MSFLASSFCILEGINISLELLYKVEIYFCFSWIFHSFYLLRLLGTALLVGFKPHQKPLFFPPKRIKSHYFSKVQSFLINSLVICNWHNLSVFAWNYERTRDYSSWRIRKLCWLSFLEFSG